MYLSEEAPYKIALAVLLILMVAGRAAFVGNWWRRRPKVSKPETGLLFIEGMLSFASAATILYLLTPWLDRFVLPFPAWLRWTGAVVFVIGDILFAWTHQALGRLWSPMLEIQTDHRLITSGPYRRIRHPMYASFFVVIAGLSILSANWVLVLAWFAGYAILLFYRIPAEERMMIEEFGDEYREYMARTGRLIPRLHR